MTGAMASLLIATVGDVVSASTPFSSAPAVERVHRVLATGTPDRLGPHIAVQPALSSEPDRDKPGTLYMNWLFEPNTPEELVEDLYMHTLALAIFAAIHRAPRARATWPQDDEIAARVTTATERPRRATAGGSTSRPSLDRT